MIKVIAELKSVVDKWVGNLHLDTNIPHKIAIQMCEQFIEFLKKDEEEKIKAQQFQDEIKTEIPNTDEAKNV